MTTRQVSGSFRFSAEFPVFTLLSSLIFFSVYLVEYGKWDLRKGIENGHEQDLKLYMQQMLKRTVDGLQIRSTPEDPVTQLNVIIDMDGYGSRQASYPRG